jgi:hypothetical protein
MLSDSFKKRSITTSVLGIILVVLSSPLSAQQGKNPPEQPVPLGAIFTAPPPGDNPGMDSPTIYRSFFNYHDRLSNWIDSQTAANSPERKKLVESTTKLHRIREQEYDKVATISHSAAAALKQVETEASGYLHSAKSKGTPVGPTVLQQYEQTRQTILSGAIRELQSSLSTDSWRNLRAYLNEEYRLQIHLVQTRALQPVPVQPPGTTTRR